MKRTFLTLLSLVFFFGFTAKAQDTIVVKDGRQIISKVMEIRRDIVIYKLHPDSSNTEYGIEKEDIDWIYFRSGIRLAQADIFKNDSSATESFFINDMEIGKEITDEEIPEDDSLFEDDEVAIDFSRTISYTEKRRLFPPSGYVRQPGDPYDPVLAGVASYFVPGLGQMISGETLRGLAFMGGELLAYSTAMIGFAAILNTTTYYDEPMFVPLESATYNSNNRRTNQFWSNAGVAMTITGIAGWIGIHIWNIVDAVQVAKVNNMYFQAQRQQEFSLSLRPFLGVDRYSQFNSGSNYAGVTVSLSF